MRPIQHLYVTAHGQYAAGPWLGEAGQFGLRLTIGQTGAMPEKGTMFTIPVNGDAVIAQGTETGTHGTLYKSFGGRRGGTGSNENFDGGFLIDLAEDVWKFLDAIKGTTSSAWRWTSVKFMPVGTDGRVCTDENNKPLASSIYQFTTPLAGTGSGLLPPQCATAVSLRAPVLGRRGRGRIYLPALANNQCDTTGVWATTQANTVRAAFVTLVNDLQNLPGAPDYLPLVSIMSPGQNTAFRPLEVRTGQRIDTIRSRREQTVESYTTTAL